MTRINSAARQWGQEIKKTTKVKNPGLDVSDMQYLGLRTRGILQRVREWNHLWLRRQRAEAFFIGVNVNGSRSVSGAHRHVRVEQAHDAIVSRRVRHTIV